MGDESGKKGKELEMAVKNIENAIISHNPVLKNSDFKIIPRYKPYPGMEIDLYVEISFFDKKIPKHVYIFESKNWDSSPVDRKELNDFLYKVREVNAVIGFVVAKKLTKEAKRFVKENEDKLEFLETTDNFDISNLYPIICNSPYEDPADRVTKIEFHTDNEEELNMLNKVELSMRTPVMFKGKKCKLEEVMKDIVDAVVNEKVQQVVSFNAKPGVQVIKGEKDIKFTESELKINNLTIKSVKIAVETRICIMEPRVKSMFSVKERGIVINYEYGLPTGGLVELTRVHTIH